MDGLWSFYINARFYIHTVLSRHKLMSDAKNSNVSFLRFIFFESKSNLPFVRDSSGKPATWMKRSERDEDW
jgi:hypothetical protein